MNFCFNITSYWIQPSDLHDSPKCCWFGVTVPLNACSSFALSGLHWGSCKKCGRAKAGSCLNDGVKLVRCRHSVGHSNSIFTQSPPPNAPHTNLLTRNCEGNKCGSLRAHHSTSLMFAESLMTAAVSMRICTSEWDSTCIILVYFWKPSKCYCEHNFSAYYLFTEGWAGSNVFISCFLPCRWIH